MVDKLKKSILARCVFSRKELRDEHMDKERHFFLLMDGFVFKPACVQKENYFRLDCTERDLKNWGANHK